MTSTELERRIAQLEAENEALRSGAAVEPTVEPAPLAHRPKRSWAWTLLATVLITLGALLAPVAVIATWVKADLTDTDRFVASFAPLADDPAVQAFVADQTVAVINENIDVAQLTSDVFDGIVQLGVPPRAADALETLKGPAASGLQSLIESQVAAFVSSDAFADVWATALRVSHTQLVATMQNDPDSAISIGANGEVGVQLGPIVEAAKKALLDRGIEFASRIPTVDRTIVVAQSDAIPAAQVGYGVAVGAGIWLPWVAIGLLALGVLVARRRAVALIAAAVALALSMAVLAVLLAVGQAVFATAAGSSGVPVNVSDVLFETVVNGMRGTAVAVLTLAIVVAVVGWFAGPFETPARLRGVARSAAAEVRAFAEERRVTTGRVGEWIYRQRVLVRSAVAVIASLVVVFVRPLSPSLVLWTLFIALLAIAVVELVQRPPAVVAPDIVIAPDTANV
jgi:hypothetical protein